MLSLTWNTVTMAQSRESKFFLSGTVSPVSVRRLNLQPKMCIPRMLGEEWRRLKGPTHLVSFSQPPGNMAGGSTGPILQTQTLRLRGQVLAPGRRGLRDGVGIHTQLQGVSRGSRPSHAPPGSRRVVPGRVGLT